MLQTILLIVHIFVAIALVGIILLQRSEGSGLISSSSGSPSSFMTPRGRAQGITRLTAVLAGLFIASSLALAILAGNHGQGTSLLDQLPAGPAAPADAGKPVTPATTPAPAKAPDVPLSK